MWRKFNLAILAIVAVGGSILFGTWARVKYRQTAIIINASSLRVVAADRFGVTLNLTLGFFGVSIDGIVGFDGKNNHGILLDVNGGLFNLGYGESISGIAKWSPDARDLDHLKGRT